MTLEEVRNLPPLTKEEADRIRNFPEDFSDPECPPMAEEQLKQFKPYWQVHPEWYRPKKVAVTIRLDIDVVEKYKSMGKGYQTRINADLRKALNLDE